MQKSKFVKGALWLTLTTLALRAAGMGYRVYISTKLGQEGMGLYQIVLSVYMLGAAFATAGISITVTRLVSGEAVSSGRKSVQNVVRFATGWCLTIGTMVAAVIFIGAPFIATRLLHFSAGASGLRILALGLPFMSLAAVFNGYFLARSKVRWSCIAQIAEQTIRIGLVVFLLEKRITTPLTTVFMGNAVSEMVATALLILFYLKDIRYVREGGHSKPVFPRFLPIQLPIATGRYVSSLLHTVENILVPDRLALYGGNRSAALSDFGALKGMALPLIMFPSSFLSSLTGLLIPELTAAKTLRYEERIKILTTRTLKLCFCFSVLMGGLFFRYGGQLGQLLYHSQQVGRLLQWLAPLIPFMYLDCVADSLLKGIGEQLASLRYSTTDSILRILLILILLDKLGLFGLLAMMFISNTSVSLFGLRRLLKVTKAPFPFRKGFLLPLSGVLLATLVTARISSLWISGAVYLVVYLLFLLFSGALSLKELTAFFKPQQ